MNAEALRVICLYVLSRYHRHAELRTAAALGAAGGLLFLTRMNGGAFIVGFGATTHEGATTSTMRSSGAR